MKIDIKTWIIVGLLIAFGLYILLDKDPQPNGEKITALEMALAIADNEIVELRADSSKLATRVRKDSLSQANAQIAYKIELAKNRAAIADLKANPEVIRVIEESPAVGTLIAKQDRLIELQASRIDTLTTNLSELRVDMENMRANFGATLKLEREKFSHQQELTDEYKQQLRKEKRKVKIFKAVAVIGTVAGLLLRSL
jgi:uncharacterized protein YpmS